LEQFEVGYLFDVFVHEKVLLFYSAVFLFFIIEKALNLFVMENFIGLLLADLIRSNLPKKLHYTYYILLPMFMSIFAANITGLFAFAFTETASVPLVFLFSAITFTGIFLTALDINRNYFLNTFLPKGTPNAILKLIIFIEFVSYCTRLISLALRLLANMISGHILLKILISFV